MGNDPPNKGIKRNDRKTITPQYTALWMRSLPTSSPLPTCLLESEYILPPLSKRYFENNVPPPPPAPSPSAYRTLVGSSCRYDIYEGHHLPCEETLNGTYLRKERSH